MGRTYVLGVTLLTLAACSSDDTPDSGGMGSTICAGLASGETTIEIYEGDFDASDSLEQWAPRATAAVDDACPERAEELARGFAAFGIYP